MTKLVLDHIAVLGETLAEAVGHVEHALGQPMSPGGDHPRFGTHNQLIGLDPDLYIEAIAINPSADHVEGARWFGLDEFKSPARLDKWVCKVDDIDAALEIFPMAGRKVRMSRGGLEWTMAVPEDGLLPFDGLFPALIEWHVNVAPGKSLPSAGQSLEALVITHPRAAELEALLSPHLDAPLVSFKTGGRGLSALIRSANEDVVLS